MGYQYMVGNFYIAPMVGAWAGWAPPAPPALIPEPLAGTRRGEPRSNHFIYGLNLNLLRVGGTF